MSLSLGQRLQRIANRSSLYELVITHPDGRRYLLAYCGRKSRAGIYAACAGRASHLLELTGSESITWGDNAAAGGTMGDWQIRFSGRTQRECYISGELPYIGRVVSPPPAECDRFDGGD
jgi:hypothetical protein